MGDLPPYASLVGTASATFYGLLAHGADDALNATYEFAWQKDKALLGVVDQALHGAANGSRAAVAAKPRWLDGLIARELRAASTTYWSQERFVRVRLLERLGLVNIDPDDTYVLAMISALGPKKAQKCEPTPTSSSELCGESSRSRAAAKSV